jgi:hypothetical protein
MELLWKRATPEPVFVRPDHPGCAETVENNAIEVEFVTPAASSMLDLVPPVYLVALGLGVAAVFVVLFYSFTSNSNYESQMRRQQLAERRAKQAAAEAHSSRED